MIEFIVGAPGGLAPREPLGHKPAKAEPDHRADQNAANELVTRARDAEIFEIDLQNNHRDHRADSIDQDAFPEQNGVDAGFDFYVLQQRRDDRWAGHDHQRPEEERFAERHMKEIKRCGNRANEADHRADCDQISDRFRCETEIVEIQRQAAFKENDDDTQRDDGAETAGDGSLWQGHHRQRALRT